MKCDVKDPKGCSEKEVKYIETMKAKDADAVHKELDRLKGMKVCHQASVAELFYLRCLQGM